MSVAKFCFSSCGKSGTPSVWILFAACFCVFHLPAVLSAEDAQAEKTVPLSMEQIYASGYWSERGVGMTWAPTGAAFIRRVAPQDGGRGQDIALETPDGDQTIIIKASELIPRDGSSDAPINVESYVLSQDSNLFLAYTNSRRIWRRNTRGDYWICDRKNNVFRKLGGDFAEPSTLQFAKISPDGTRVAYVCKNNVYAEEIVSGKIVQLTKDGSKDVINGTFDWVYEEEFDCRDGFRWSPDGKKIAFWRLDSSAEPEFVMLDDVGLSTVTGASRIEVAQLNGDFQLGAAELTSQDESNASKKEDVDDQEFRKSYPTLVAFKYPRVGCANAEVKIGVVTLPELGEDKIDVDANTKFVDFNDPEEYYLPGMEWYSGRAGLVVQKTPRSQRACETYSIDSETLAPTLLFSETDPDGAWQTVYPIYSFRDGDRFLRVSERDGWRRYYLTSFSDLSSQIPITLAEADAIDFITFNYDAEGNERGVYYYASPGVASARSLYYASLTGENVRVELLESPDGAPLEDSFRPFAFESWSISADGSWAICRRSAFGNPTRIDLVQLDQGTAKVVKTLQDNSELRARLKEQNFGRVDFFQVEIDAACDFEERESEPGKIAVDGWVMTPRDWNPSSEKKYPLLVYVYSEPAAQTVLDSWGGSTYLYHRAIAETGCVVVSFDARGTPAPKGRAWRKKIYQKFGAVGRSDQAAALKQFLELAPYSDKIDRERIGVWGWSGGGTSTLNLLFNYPDLYKCGIAIAPVADYRNYDTIYQERYSGLITETPESYQLGSAIHYANRLEGKLLIIHGSGDDNCHYQTTERLINALISAGKDFEAFNYPFRSHGIFEGQGTTLHLRKKTMDFWNRNLLAP